MSGPGLTDAFAQVQTAGFPDPVRLDILLIHKMIGPTRFTRPNLPRSIAALLALIPALAVGFGLDALTNNAAMARQPDFMMPVKETDNLKDSLDALSADQVDEARKLGGRLPAASLDRHILTWAIAMHGGPDVSSTEIAAAAAALPGWPGAETLRSNTERALYRENPAPEIVVKAFGGRAPQTLQGILLLTRAHLAAR